MTFTDFNLALFYESEMLNFFQMKTYQLLKVE